jgi:hypothetical protein
MELNNTTRFPALLFRGCIDEHRLYASLVARVTYDLRGETLAPAEAQTWPVSPGPWKSFCGPMEGDELFYRGGVDLFVFGSARPAQGKATTVDVTVQAGPDFTTTVRAFGPRRWEKRGQALVMTPPEPFEAIPLTAANAYGGADEWDSLAIPFTANPEGKGFVLCAENAEGKALPNLEDPAHLIQKWEDRPEPVGVCPCPANCGARIDGRLIFDEATGTLKELKPTFFNHAYPRMIGPFLEPGALIRVTGVSPAGPMQFPLPAAPVQVRVRIGKENDQRPMPIDQVGVDVDKKQVFVTYRYPFRYRMVPLQVRTCELL